MSTKVKKQYVIDTDILILLEHCKIQKLKKGYPSVTLSELVEEGIEALWDKLKDL